MGLQGSLYKIFRKKGRRVRRGDGHEVGSDVANCGLDSTCEFDLVAITIWPRGLDGGRRRRAASACSPSLPTEDTPLAFWHCRSHEVTQLTVSNWVATSRRGCQA